jgi:hypothetical protein
MKATFLLWNNSGKKRSEGDMKGMEGRKSQAKSLVLLYLVLFFLLKASKMRGRLKEGKVSGG